MQGATTQAITAEIQRLGLHQITMMTGEIDIVTKAQSRRYPNPVTLTLILSVTLSITPTPNPNPNPNPIPNPNTNPNPITRTPNYDDRCGRDE